MKDINKKYADLNDGTTFASNKTLDKSFIVPRQR